MCTRRVLKGQGPSLSALASPYTLALPPPLFLPPATPAACCCPALQQRVFTLPSRNRALIAPRPLLSAGDWPFVLSLTLLLLLLLLLLLPSL